MTHSGVQRIKKIEIEIKAGFKQLKIILEGKKYPPQFINTFNAHYDVFYKTEVEQAGKEVKAEQIHRNTVIALGLRLGLELLIIEKIFSDPGIPSSFNLGIKLLTLAAEEGSSILDLSWAARDLYKIYVGFYPHLKEFESKDKAAYFLNKLTTLAKNNPNTFAEGFLESVKKVEGTIDQQEVKHSESQDFIDLEAQQPKQASIDELVDTGYLMRALKYFGLYSVDDAPEAPKAKQNTYGTFEMVEMPQESKSANY